MAGRLRWWLENGDDDCGSADDLATYLAREAEWLRERVWDCGDAAGERLFELHLVIWALAEAIATDGEGPMRARLKLKRRGATGKGGRAAPAPEVEMRFALAVARARRHMWNKVVQEDAIRRAMQEMVEEGRATPHVTHDGIKTRLRQSLKRWPLHRR